MLRSNTSSLLLPRRCRVPGILLLVAGSALLIARFVFNVKPSWLDTYSFAVYSVYVETKYFTVIHNQMIEEIGGVMLFAGLILLALVKEINEGPETDLLRSRAFVLSFYFSFSFMVFSLLFLYGFGYVVAMLFFPVFSLLSYIVIFRILTVREDRRKT